LHEAEFGPLSAEFGVLDVFAVWHTVCLWVKRFVVTIFELVTRRRWVIDGLEAGSSR